MSPFKCPSQNATRLIHAFAILAPLVVFTLMLHSLAPADLFVYATIILWCGTAVVIAGGSCLCRNYYFGFSHSYYNILRIKTFFFLSFNFVVCVSFFSGIIFEIFFTAIRGFALKVDQIEGPPAKGILSCFGLTAIEAAQVYFAFLPIMMIAFALYCEYIFLLMLDAFSNPPLTGLNAALLTVFAQSARATPTGRVCFIVDFIMLFVLEGLPMFMAGYGVLRFGNLLDRTSLGAFWRAYLEWGMISGGILTFMYLCSVLYFSYCDRKYILDRKEEDMTNCKYWFSRCLPDREFISLRETHTMFERTFTMHKVFPGTLRLNQKVAFTHNTYPNSVFGTEDVTAMEVRPLRAPGHIPVDCLGYLIVGILWVIALYFGPSGWRVHTAEDYEGLPVQVMGCVLFVVVAAYSYFFTLRFNRIIGKTFTVVLIFFMTITQVLVQTSNQQLKTTEQIVFRQPDDMSKTDQESRDSSWQGGSSSYPICHMSWGSDDLSALDLSQLAGLMYAEDDEHIKAALPTIFPSPTWNVSWVNSSAHLDRSGLPAARVDMFPRWAVFDFEPTCRSESHCNNSHCGNGTRVFAFKGTSTVDDIFTDTTLWSSIKVMQLFQSLFPVLHVLPEDQIQWLIWSVRMVAPLEDAFWKRVQNIVLDYVHSTDKKVVLTGHSLGGGLAQVIAARAGLPALVWSAPGMGYSAVRFGLHSRKYFKENTQETHVAREARSNENGVQVAERRIVVVMPQSDEVPRVDKQIGVVQDIECRNSEGLYESALKCHSIRKTSCEIWRSCGDVHGDVRRINCSEFVDTRALGAWYLPDTVV